MVWPTRRSTVVITLLTTALLGLQGLLTWSIADRARRDATADTGKVVGRFVRAAEANVNRAFLQIDALLSGLQGLLPAALPQDDAAELSRRLRSLADQSFLLRDLLIIDGEGRVTAAGLTVTMRRPPALPRNFLAGETRNGALTISDPIRNEVNGEWSLYLGRTLARPEGNLTVVGELPLGVLSRLAAPDLGTAGLRVTLERRDGTVLMSAPHDIRRIGRRIVPMGDLIGLDAQWSVLPSRTDEGRIVAAAAPTLYEGLAVMAQVPEDQALVSWREQRHALIAGSLVVALFAVGVAVIGAFYLQARERAATEIRRSKQLLDQALDSMSDGFVLYDRDDRLVVANRRYRQLFPYLEAVTAPGISRRRAAEVASEHVLPEGTAEERRAWVAWRMDLQRHGAAFEQVLACGTIVESMQAATPEGGLVSLHRDVTATRQAEARLAEAKQQAETASRAKSNFLATMSHELRTPLNAIIGFAQAMADEHFGPIAATQKGYLRDIEQAGHHLLSVISAILEISRIEAGKLTLAEQEVDLARLVTDAVRLMEPLVQKAALKISTTMPADLALIRADPDKLRQAVLNLLGNAIKFTPAGGLVAVAVGTTEQDEPFIAVEDTGIGMTDAEIERVRRPFERLGSTLARDREGVGLGLPITDALMRLHGGELLISSAPGQGTRAEIRLRRA